MASFCSARKTPFLFGVFLIAFSVLIFQILQTRILSVVAWYYMAFFAISVAMLGMTVGSVWAYLRRESFESVPLPVTLSRFALLTAVAMPASMIVQFSLVTSVHPSLITAVAWSLLMAAMATPICFLGRRGEPGVDAQPISCGPGLWRRSYGAALGCASVIGLLNLLDGPTAVIVAGAIAAFSALAFSSSDQDRKLWKLKPWWQRPGPVAIVLLGFAAFNAISPVNFRPILVKANFESSLQHIYEKWNSYSRVRAYPVATGSPVPVLWGPSNRIPPDLRVPYIGMDIDGDASTTMFHYDGTPGSINFLRYDLVGLAYRLPGIHKAAVIGVGGGRDILTAHLFGVSDITGVELNPIFINLETRDPYYRSFSNLIMLPDLKLHVDDARSWFAATHEKFDLVQMSLIDTWAATGAGAFSLSENGLYTLEGWRAFLKTLNSNGVMTVSRWYDPTDVNETGRLIGLAIASLLDAGVKDPRQHIFVATANDDIATLILSKSAFTEEQLRILNGTAHDNGFSVLMAPGQPPQSELLRRAIESKDLSTLNPVLNSSFLDLSVPTDSRPFFFNQLRILDFGKMATVLRLLKTHQLGAGVGRGNLIASAVLLDDSFHFDRRGDSDHFGAAPSCGA